MTKRIDIDITKHTTLTLIIKCRKCGTTFRKWIADCKYPIEWVKPIQDLETEGCWTCGPTSLIVVGIEYGRGD